ncbi:MAG: prepilin-type N-terminal cleavage/methylation domain-containing protein [Candidatus Moraniibacteriota bacterium]
MGNRKGFTLIEIMLVIALMVLISSISVPVYQSFQVKNDLEASSNDLVQSLRRAQVLSQANEGDSTWGVKILSGGIVVFKGASYSARDVAYDEVFEIATSIVSSGISEVVFGKLSGLPQTSGDIILTTSNGDVRTISINIKGIIEY